MKTAKLDIHNVSVSYGERKALRGITFEIQDKEILGVIGPANSGKTSLLRTLNRLNEHKSDFKISGSIHLDGVDIYKDIAVSALRKRIGMIFALPNPLPLSIYDNIAYGPRMHGKKKKAI